MHQRSLLVGEVVDAVYGANEMKSRGISRDLVLLDRLRAPVEADAVQPVCLGLDQGLVAGHHLRVGLNDTVADEREPPQQLLQHDAFRLTLG